MELQHQSFQLIYVSLVAQSCPTLCDPIHYSLSGSSVPGVLQTRILEWATMSFSKGSFQHRNQMQVSHTAGRFFTLSHLSNEYSALVFFRIDWYDLLAVRGTLKSLLQHHSSKASIFRRSALFIVQLSHPYMAWFKKVFSLLVGCRG